MHIRRARVVEAAALSALARQSKSRWPYTAAQLAAWSDDLAVSSATIASCPAYVAEKAGEPLAGFYVLEPSSPHWKLEHLWVAPQFMRQGVGRALLAHAADIALQGGAAVLAIDSDPNAESFYLACGARWAGSIAAPLPDFPDRQRPQLLLSTNRPGPRDSALPK